MPGEVDMDDCTFFGFHTILFDLGGVVVDFGAYFFCFHTIFFFGGVGTTFGVSYFCFGVGLLLVFINLSLV